MHKHRPFATETTVHTRWLRRDRHMWVRWTLIALLFLAGAGGAAWWQMARTDRRLRAEFLLYAKLVSTSVNAAAMEALPFEKGAQALPDVQRMKHHLQQLYGDLRSNIVPTVTFASIYSMRLHEGRIVFGPESIPEYHHYASPPGTQYRHPPPGLKKLFAAGPPLIVGPYTDEYGTFVSAFVPLLDSAGRRTTTVIGMDVAARDWRRAVSIAAARAVMLTVVAMTVLLLGVFSARANHRIRSQQAVLRASEQHFRTLVENTPGVTYLCRNDARLSMIYISAQIRQLTGHDRDAFLKGAISFVDIFHPDDAGQVRQQVNAAVACKTSFHLTYRLRHTDGTWRWVEEWGTTLRDGSGVLLEGFIADVTGRVKDEERLLFQAQVLDSVSEAVVVTNLEGNILYWGRGAEALYGYAAGDVLGRPYHQFAGSVEHADRDAFRQCILAQGSWSGEHRQRRRDGTLFWASVFISVLRDAAGRPIGFIGLDHDITEQKRAAQKHEALRATAEALAGVFLGLGSNSQANIDRIVRAACDLTGGVASLYNRLDDAGGSLVVWSGHHLPADMPRADAPQGHICYEATIRGQDRTIVLGNLEDTDYARTDAVIRTYGLKAYLGHPVRLRGRTIGALAVVDTKPRVFAPSDIGAIQMLAQALSLEEERRLVEQELRQNEARNRALLAVMPDLMFVIRRDGYFIDCNTNNPDLLLLPPHAFLNKHADEVLPADVAAMTLAVVEKLFQSRQTQVYEYQLDVRGERRHFETRVVIATEDSALCIVRDTTDHKRAEEAERRQRADRDLISRMATMALEEQEPARVQQELLRLLGDALDVSRVYIFTHRHETNTMDNTAAWTAPGVTSQRDNVQGISADANRWWYDRLQRGEDICFADIEDIPDDAAKQALRPQGIQAILIVPLFIGTRYRGFIGFDECRRRRAWAQRERDLLAEAARILMGVWADEDLRQSEERFQGILQNVATVAVQGYAMDGTVRYWNRASETFYGYTAAEAIGRNLMDLIIPPAMRAEVRAAIRNMIATGTVIPAAELALMRKDGSLIPVYSSHALVRVPGQDIELFCIDIDLTERKQAEAEQEQLQAQFAQAQKMESVGRLAGGVAHDFNNMLQAILGYTELALTRVVPHDPLHGDLREVQAVAQRSAELTRKLLAFARKQTVAPKVLDLNETVAGMINMLRRLIGEDITLQWSPGSGLWPVKIDPVQLDQILANLCVNARDAIAGVGTVAIETANVSFDEDDCNQNPGCAPGEYVLLAISDTGCGMDADTLSHLFEPFFTTKETGKGTGLGLATVYGVVRQNNGVVNVCSTPGHGTTFKLYLPRHMVKAAAEEEHKPHMTAGGGETILLVEDEPAILKATTKMLESLGYDVVTAATPGEAIRLAQEYSGRIDVLLTDVVMPEMSGRDLAKNLLSIYPDLARLFMSGYTADVIAHRGVLDEGVHFLQKPFTVRELAAKLREALSETDGGRQPHTTHRVV